MINSIARQPIRQWLTRSTSRIPRKTPHASVISAGRRSTQTTPHLQIKTRSYQTTAAPFQPDNVHVTIETSQKSQPQSGTKDDKCGPVDEEEMEQEEMFVTSDPILGHGNIKEWGGPRRGGRLAEPTRFGDWERKGRCTDF